MIVDCQGNTKRGVVIATVLMTLSVICFTGSYLANSEFHDDWVERDGVVSVVATAQLGNKAYLALRNSSTALECVTPSECTGTRTWRSRHLPAPLRSVDQHHQVRQEGMTPHLSPITRRLKSAGNFNFT